MGHRVSSNGKVKVWQDIAGEKTSRKIEIGCLHFSSNEYHQVRPKNGGGTRNASVEKTIVAEILQKGKKLFSQMDTHQKEEQKTLLLMFVILKNRLIMVTQHNL